MGVAVNQPVELMVEFGRRKEKTLRLETYMLMEGVELVILRIAHILAKPMMDYQMLFLIFKGGSEEIMENIFLGVFRLVEVLHFLTKMEKLRVGAQVEKQSQIYTLVEVTVWLYYITKKKAFFTNHIHHMNI
jgi:hypothetical protein